MVPEPSEEAEEGVQKAVFLTDQQAVVVLNRRRVWSWPPVAEDLGATPPGDHERRLLSRCL